REVQVHLAQRDVLCIYALGGGVASIISGNRGYLKYDGDQFCDRAGVDCKGVRVKPGQQAGAINPNLNAVEFRARDTRRGICGEASESAAKAKAGVGVSVIELRL